MKTGAELIAEERIRQHNQEGYSVAHDDAHDLGELAVAALCYATVASAQVVEDRGAQQYTPAVLARCSDGLLTWPWSGKDWKPAADPIRNLIKAGALLAAEIDRLQRLAEKGKTQ